MLTFEQRRKAKLFDPSQGGHRINLRCNWMFETWGRTGRLRDNCCYIIAVNIPSVTARCGVEFGPLTVPRAWRKELQRGDGTLRR